MNLQDLGAIGELISGVVVVATLIYLAIQLRQNTETTQAQTTASVALEMEQALLALAQNADLAIAYQKALQRKELSEIELIRLGFWWAAFVRSAHSHVVQDKLGNLTEDNTNTARQILREFARIPMLRTLLKNMIDRKQYPDDFCDWLTDNVISVDAQDPP